MNISEAKEKLANKLLTEDSNVHTVSIGLKERDGHLTDEIAICVYTSKKVPIAAAKDLKEQVVFVPEKYEGFLTDVIEEPQPTDLRLDFSELAESQSRTPSNAQILQQCHNCPIPGGVQISPKDATWVGTLGCLIGHHFNTWVADTNYHVAVAGKFDIGHQINQPGGPGPHIEPIADLLTWVPIEFSINAKNILDYAVLDVRRYSGIYAPITDTVGPIQHTIGQFTVAENSDFRLNQAVHKIGRTTGYTEGKCVGVDSSVLVQYKEGTARFEKQLIVKGKDGDFSAAGDSGSTIFLKSANNLIWGKLFAGGGSRTYANPYDHILRWLKNGN